MQKSYSWKKYELEDSCVIEQMSAGTCENKFSDLPVKLAKSISQYISQKNGKYQLIKSSVKWRSF